MARRKQRRSNKARNKRPVRRWLWLLAASLGFLGAGALSLALYAERRVAPLLDGASRPHYTTRVYSAPLRLRQGTPLSTAELKHRLERLGYRRV